MWFCLCASKMCGRFESMNEINSANDCIFHLLSKVSRAGTRFWKQSVAEYGVTPVQAKVLIFLREMANPTSSQLGEETSLDSATLTGLLDRLESMKLLYRTPHKDDRRAVIVALTEQGREMSNTLFEMVPPANRVFLSDLSPEEAMMLRGILKRF